MARQQSLLAILFLFSLFVASEGASAQSAAVIAAEQSCTNAAKQQGNDAATVTACTEALSLAPNNATMALLLCASQSGVGNYNAALTSCTRAIAINAKAENAYADRCYSNLALGNLANAISDCNEQRRSIPATRIRISIWQMSI
jgi:hypothetical protein